MSSVAVMCLRATIFRPLRSKRAMISPVRPRAKATGLTRIRVRSDAMAGQRSPAALLRRVVHGRRLLGDAAAGGARGGRHRRGARHDLVLAVRADLPARVQRLGAAATRLLELV